MFSRTFWMNSEKEVIEVKCYLDTHSQGIWHPGQTLLAGRVPTPLGPSQPLCPELLSRTDNPQCHLYTENMFDIAFSFFNSQAWGNR